MGPESALTRRALLSGGTLFSLTGLLAACGQQTNNEAAATASAAPSETATASASATEASSASATPSPVITPRLLRWLQSPRRRVPQGGRVWPCTECPQTS